ncbi:MAG: iron-containing alcohol dehydrogenase [Oscillibacter sp.]|jgi:alcohol dehydrogenase|nr:iron-containing alcohol dehydrogenase [Oscillibacter sp.]
MIAFDAYNAPRIIYGEGVSTKVADLLKTLHVKNIMAVYDEGIKKVGIADRVIEPIRAAGFTVEEFGGVTADPPAEMIEDAAKLGKAKNIDVYIAIGGGGVIDTTKCMAVMQTNSGKLLDYVLGRGKNIENMCPHIIAIPTTSGTGSEVTALSIVTDTATHRKVCIKDVVKMCPYAAYLDPELTLGLPKGLTASTGMDALSHAVEAYMVGRHNEFADMFCENAIRRVIKWLPVAVADGKNVEARGQMMQAATYGGASFASSTLQAGHAIAHALGGALHVPHGIACAWGLNFAIQHCGKTMPIERLEALAGFMGAEVAGKDRDALVAACCKIVTDLNTALNVPTPKTFGIGTVEEMEQAYNACWTNEQGMLGVAGVTDKDELHAYFVDMWNW